MIHEETTTGKRQRYSIRKAIQTIKTVVLIEQVAAEYTQLKCA